MEDGSLIKNSTAENCFSIFILRLSDKVFSELHERFIELHKHFTGARKHFADAHKMFTALMKLSWMLVKCL